MKNKTREQKAATLYHKTNYSSICIEIFNWIFTLMYCRDLYFVYTANVATRTRHTQKKREAKYPRQQRKRMNDVDEQVKIDVVCVCVFVCETIVFRFNVNFKQNICWTNELNTLASTYSKLLWFNMLWQIGIQCWFIELRIAEEATTTTTLNECVACARCSSKANSNN